MKKALTAFLWLVTAVCYAQAQVDPREIREDKSLSAALDAISRDLGLDGEFDCGEDGMERISLAVVDLSGPSPVIGGVSMDNFIYPASVYKMYVAAEVLRQVAAGRLSLNDPYVVRAPNDVDRSKEINWDPRPLLRDGDTVTIGYLVDLMITRSDNSAANCLIDVARRENINAFLRANGWRGSEVTRKFLRRKFEDAGYDTIRGTETSARHAAEFLAKIQTRRLANEWTSAHLKSYLMRQLDTTKLATGLPTQTVFSHKTGWFSTWTHDVGIVEEGATGYVIACFLPITEDLARPKMKMLAERVHALMRSRGVGR